MQVNLISLISNHMNGPKDGPTPKKNFLDDDDPIDEDIKLKYIKSLYLHAINYLPPNLFKPEVTQLHKLL